MHMHVLYFAISSRIYHIITLLSSINDDGFCIYVYRSQKDTLNMNYEYENSSVCVIVMFQHTEQQRGNHGLCHLSRK
jgi:hypothetical protein